jgi:hypothetical protein
MELVDNAYVSDNQQGAGLYVWNLEVFFFPFVSHTGYDMQLVEQGRCICQLS